MTKSLLELVEIEIRELLGFYEFDEDNTPIIQGSALGALTEMINGLLLFKN